MICLRFALLGSIWDAPMAWRWTPTLAALPVLVITLLVLPRRRAHPLPVRFGPRAWLLACSIAVVSMAAGLGTGLALQALAVPAALHTQRHLAAAHGAGFISVGSLQVWVNR